MPTRAITVLFVVKTSNTVTCDNSVSVIFYISHTLYRAKLKAAVRVTSSFVTVKDVKIKCTMVYTMF